MYDLEKVGKIFGDIERYFKELELFGLNEKNLDNLEKFYASSMVIYAVLSRMIDLAEEIIMKNHFGIPQSYQEYFDVLREHSIIDSSLCEELKYLSKSRNLFAHEYYNLNRKEILKIQKRISAVKQFTEKIKREIGKEIKK